MDKGSSWTNKYRPAIFFCGGLWNLVECEMRPHRTMKQNVTTEKYSVSPIQKANMIRSLAGRVNHFQIPAAQIEPVTIP